MTEKKILNDDELEKVSGGYRTDAKSHCEYSPSNRLQFITQARHYVHTDDIFIIINPYGYEEETVGKIESYEEIDNKHVKLGMRIQYPKTQHGKFKYVLVHNEMVLCFVTKINYD